MAATDIIPACAKSLTELSNIISQQTEIIEKYHIQNGLPLPSLAASNQSLEIELPPHVAQARDRLLEATDELQARVQGPMGYLFNKVVQRHNENVSLHAISKFNLAGDLSVGKEATYSQIASKHGLDEDDVRRILRHAISNHIFISPRPGFVAHNGPSQALAETPSLRAAIQHTMEDMAPAANHVAFAIQSYPGSQSPTQTAFSMAHRTSKPFFEEIASSKARIERFAMTMKMFSSGSGFATTHLVHGFDWASLGRDALVVDVGGSNGSTGRALLEAFPKLRCMVQDRPEVLNLADMIAHGETNERLSFLEHDFFEEQPIKDATAFLLRLILHDWSDEYSIKILRCLIPAMRPGTKIIVMDFCAEDLLLQSNPASRALSSLDMVMKSCFNGRERNRTEWLKLIEMADCRFKVLEIVQPVGSKLSLIVCEWCATIGNDAPSCDLAM